jgi:hypothetical protein
MNALVAVTILGFTITRTEALIAAVVVVIVVVAGWFLLRRGR